ncbi:hypothetical protein BDZ89DRAFT_1062182 [Hymenopellis radicata]|nr:hypothetical protein BDZ89DRAFT_1062182 [Hymenopellis radicata]
MKVTLAKTEDAKRKRKAEFVKMVEEYHRKPRTAYHRGSHAQSCVFAPPYSMDNRLWGKHQALISVYPQDFHTTRAPLPYALRPSTRYHSCT